MRVVGLDLGDARIGVAVSDPGGVLASPHSVLKRASDRAEDHRHIAALVAETGAGLVVVGLPLSLSGKRGPQARAVLAEVEDLRRILDVPVETHDERLTTVSAARALREAGKRSRQARDEIDQAAAAILLQSWLDTSR